MTVQMRSMRTKPEEDATEEEETHLSCRMEQNASAPVLEERPTITSGRRPKDLVRAGRVEAGRGGGQARARGVAHRRIGGHGGRGGRAVRRNRRRVDEGARWGGHRRAEGRGLHAVIIGRRSQMRQTGRRSVWYRGGGGVGKGRVERG